MTELDRPAVPRRPSHRWEQGTVAEIRDETRTARTLRLEIDGWAGHVAGQHVDVRLTAADGYRATRSYSLSSAAAEEPAITVERTGGGEVSPYLVDVARTGDHLEVRGPFGGYFVWDITPAAMDPVLLLAGGSGVAPMRAIWRTALPLGTPVGLVYSARTRGDVMFTDELGGEHAPVTVIHLTRDQAPGFQHGRIDPFRLSDLITDRTRVYVCGPTGFVEDIATGLTDAGLPRHRLRTERFG